MAAITKAERKKRRALLEQGLKHCPKCERVLPLSCFAKSSSTSDGLQSYCRKCVASYYYEDRERRLEWQKRYGVAHSKERSDYNQAYYNKNRESLLEYQNLYYEENKDRIRAYQARHAETEQGKAAKKTSSRRRKARERNQASDLTTGQWLEALEHFGNACAYCGEIGELHQEHFIPAARGGGLTASNIIPACSRCNLSKRDSMPVHWARTRGRKFVSLDSIEKIESYLESVV